MDILWTRIIIAFMQTANCAFCEQNHPRSIIRAENRAESSKVSIEEEFIIPLRLQASDPLSQVLDGSKGWF